MRFSSEDGSPMNLETENIGNEGIPQERPALRLDDIQDDMVIVKCLLRMLPMWVMFFVVSIISATGATFFLLQYSNLNVNNKIPIQMYNIVQGFSSFAILILYNQFRYLSKKENVEIGVGMFCGIISCILAWRLEVYRLKEVGHLVDKDSNTSISFLWLMPQFCLLGCMEGLTRDGVLKIYKFQMNGQPLLISYGEEYMEMVMGFGLLMNIFLVLVFNRLKGWFGDTINDSRLDKYYLVLVFVCLVNFILYCCVASYFYPGQVLANNDQDQDNQEQQNHDLADDPQEQVHES
ncbi:putative proton-dependent oligopeptide transporter family, MFS transporter superfamily [Helianthus anomalus]